MDFATVCIQGTETQSLRIGSMVHNSPVPKPPQGSAKIIHMIDLLDLSAWNYDICISIRESFYMYP
jgi:hypothetical protein